MMVILHKKILIFAAIVTAVVFSMALTLGDTVPTATDGKSIVVIDPGHGGMDSGASGADGTAEKDINLSISRLLAQKLQDNGFEVVMTRETDTSLHTDDDASVRNQKRQDLKKRKEMAKNSGALAYLGIHLNKFEESQYKGAQVFYAEKEGSQDLAQSIQKSLIEGLQDGNSRVAKESEDIYILKNVNIPSVIVECGFLSNPDELALLKQPEYQEKVADCICKGFLDYLAHLQATE